MPLPDTSGAAGLGQTVAAAAAAILAADGRPVDQSGLDLPLPAAPVGDTCSQLSVCMESVTRLDSYTPALQGIQETGHWATSGVARFIIRYSITILRCVGTDAESGALPTATAIQLGRDVWLLANMLKEGHRTGSLFDPNDEWWYEGSIPVHNQGNYAGWFIGFGIPFDALGVLT